MRKLAVALGIVAVSTLAVPVVAATAAEETPTVSITVEMDLPSESDGPIVFEVVDAPIGAGPELSGDDLVSNPSDWCGSLFVDVDLDTDLVIITPDEACNFETASVVIESDAIGDLTLVSDDLWDTYETDDEPVDSIPAEPTDNGDSASSPSALVQMVLAYGPVDGAQGIYWTTDTESESLDMNEEGAAVFSFTQIEPTTTTTAPTTTTAQAAAAVTPRFTG